MKLLAGLLVLCYLVADYWVHNEMLKQKDKQQGN